MNTKHRQLLRRACLLISPLALAAALLVLVGSAFAAQRLGSLARITSASDGLRDSYYPSLSADGTGVAFAGDSDFLNEGRSDDMWEVWLWEEYQYHTYLPLVLRQYQ